MSPVRNFTWLVACVLLFNTYVSHAQEKSTIEPDGAMSVDVPQQLINIPNIATHNHAKMQTSLSQQKTVYQSDKQSISLISTYDPFYLEAQFFQEPESEKVHTAVTGVNYQYASEYGVTQVQVVANNADKGGQLFDVSYGYPMAFFEQRGLVKVNLGADYLNLDSINNDEGQHRIRSKNEHELSPYFSVDGFWKLNQAWHWRYNLKYQLKSAGDPSETSDNSDKSIVIYTGVDFRF